MPLLKAAIPSLPSMRGRFTLPCSTLRVHTSAQVSGTLESGAMGRREVTCSAVPGKSLARALGGPLWLERPQPQLGPPVAHLGTSQGAHQVRRGRSTPRVVRPGVDT